jgi:hypothetical protein
MTFRVSEAEILSELAGLSLDTETNLLSNITLVHTA